MGVSDEAKNVIPLKFLPKIKNKIFFPLVNSILYTGASQNMCIELLTFLQFDKRCFYVFVSVGYK
jgi:hypothetical protein